MSEILLEEDEGFVDDLGLDVKTVEEWLNQVSYKDDPDYVPFHKPEYEGMCYSYKRYSIVYYILMSAYVNSVFSSYSLGILSHCISL